MDLGNVAADPFRSRYRPTATHALPRAKSRIDGASGRRSIVPGKPEPPSTGKTRGSRIDPMRALRDE